MTGSSEATKLYLEDIQVGQESVSAEHALDAKQIIAHARQFDPQPFYLDDTAAQGTFFQGVAASGWQMMSITMKLIVKVYNLTLDQADEVLQELTANLLMFRRPRL